MRNLVAVSMMSLLAVVLSGCLASDQGAPVDGTDTASQALLEVVARAHLTETGDGFEPSIAVGPEGTLYATAAQGLGNRASRLWVSNDDGASWREIPPIDPDTGVSNFPLGAEGDVAVDAAGNAYYIDLTHLVGTSVSRSTDQGHTWTLGQPSAFVVPGGDREWVDAGRDGFVAITWNQLATGMWVAVSTDGGLTFPTQTFVPDFVMAPGFVGLDSRTIPGQRGATFAGPIAVGPENEIYVARDVEGGPIMVRSLDGGQSFDVFPIHETEDYTGRIFSVPAVDDAGTVYVTWTQDVEGKETHLFYAYSTDQGATWSAPWQIDADVEGSVVLPWMDAGAPGEAAFVFYGAPGEQGIPADMDADWYPYLVTATGADTSSPRLELLRLADEPIRQGNICTSGLGCDGGRELADFQEVAIGPDGAVHSIYGDERRNTYWAKVTLPGSTSAFGVHAQAADVADATDT